MTKKDIVREISKRLSTEEFKITQLKAKEIVQFTFDAIIETLLEEKRIELRNFGVFEVKTRKERKARNPRTGDPVQVPAKNVVTFKPGKVMEQKVAELTDLPELDEDEALMDGENTDNQPKKPTRKPSSNRSKKS